jgi:hypothetical protein
MKAQILKIAGVKSEKEFYKKYKTEADFMKVHGKEFKKAQTGAAINASQVRQPAFKPLNYQDQFDDVDKMLTGSTAAQRQELALKQQSASKDSGGGGFDIAGLMKLAGGAMQGGGMGDMGGAAAGASSVAAARYGRDIPRAQFGGNYDLGKSPDFSVNMPQGFPKQKSSFSMATPKFNAYDPQGDQAGGKMAQGIFSGAHSVADSPFSAPGDSLSKIGGAVSQLAGPVGSIISGIGQLAGAKKARKAAEQARDVSKVSLKAAESVDVDARRQQSENIAKQREAQMPVNTGEEFFPIFGAGTNILARNGMMLQGGGEIQNTFAPNDIYTDSGYEPLNDSNIKQYAQGGRLPKMLFGGAASGGGTPWGAISGAATGIGQSLMGGQNAGGGLGSTIGSTLGMVGGPIGSAIGGFVGGIAGNLLDTNSKKMKKAQAETERNMQGMANANMAKGIQAQNQSYMKDGGWVSHDWQPQVIASFGGLDEQEVYDYAHEGMDTLRAGGHLRDYTPPSDRAMETYEDGGEIQSYGLGGELQTHWGGGAETISRNPYLPGTGETIMFRGKSHEEYSPNGETGIGVTYGGNPVEVERGEPMVELEEGGTIDPETGEVQKSGVVFGNLQIPNQYIDMLGDKNAKGKKFKNYVADLSKIEEKQNSIIDKSSKELNALDPINSFDKLKLTALQANIQGANMKLKELADKKINAASLQNAINDTAEEHGLVADDLARGKAKVDKKALQEYAEYGKQMFADGGSIIDPLEQLKDLLGSKGFDYKQSSGTRAGSKTKQGKASRHSTGEAMDLTFPKLGKDSYNAMLQDPEIAQFMLDNNLTAIDEYDDDIRKQTGGSGGHLHIGLDKGTAVSDRFRNQAQALYGAKTPATTTDSTTGAPTTTTEVTKPPRMTIAEAIKAGYKLNPKTKQYELIVKGVQTPGTATNEGTALEKIPEGQKRGTSGLYGKVTQEAFEKAKQENPWFDWTGFDPSKKADVKKYQDAFNAKAKEIGSKAYIKPDSAFGEQTASARIAQAKQQTPPADTIQIADVYDPEATTTTEETTKTNWWDTASTVANAILPSIRPSDAEGLDTAQLYPEMFAMATNQVAPVQAQTFQPDLGVPYDISYQDQLNANQADYRAAQRMMGYNPAAQANLNAQKYQANQSVLADQFRANQGMKDKVYGENRNMLNQAKLTNLGIFDKQYERQTEALANTKATTQAALNSISDKYAKNKLENRELKTYENMYNYRFGPNFRAQNMNPLAQWDTDYKGASAEELDAMSAYKKALAKREAAEEKKKKPSLAGESIAKRNGSIVKSYKNI